MTEENLHPLCHTADKLNDLRLPWLAVLRSPDTRSGILLGLRSNNAGALRSTIWGNVNICVENGAGVGSLVVALMRIDAMRKGGERQQFGEEYLSACQVLVTEGRDGVLNLFPGGSTWRASRQEQPDRGCTDIRHRLSPFRGQAAHRRRANGKRYHLDLQVPPALSHLGQRQGHHIALSRRNASFAATEQIDRFGVDIDAQVKRQLKLALRQYMEKTTKEDLIPTWWGTMRNGFFERDRGQKSVREALRKVEVAECSVGRTEVAGESRASYMSPTLRARVHRANRL
ncbi:hypothetical protein SVAN01_00026 [Stagonosporopsis vannaccii]|nr:hypothetical protein SVAN01_00026 [Stagonosporopsis vannaccii]